MAMFVQQSECLCVLVLFSHVGITLSDNREEVEIGVVGAQRRLM